MFHLKQVNIRGSLLTGCDHNLFNRRQLLIAAAPWHVRRKDLIAITNIWMLGQQRTKHTAAATTKVPVDDADQEPDCVAAGWNMNIE